jgi:formate hydrogenlyase subunit 6/NADH:ubiquinone oxidoreductase subunit I
MKCVRICPANIFVIKPSETNSVGDKCEIAVLFKALCNGCMKCIEACPHGCIHLEF